MRSLLQIFALLCAVIGYSDAKVKFAHSTMYDIYDFQGVSEISLLRCYSGCLIYASTIGDTQWGGYLSNLIINDPVQGRQLSIAELAFQFQPMNSQKVPFDISGPGNYSIINRNALTEIGSDVTVWVIERATAHAFDYEIYDAAAMTRFPTPPSSVLTIMSAARFAVYAEGGVVNSFAARQVGFDNAFDDNKDRCAAVFQKPQSTLDDFTLYVNAPIISFVFTHKTKIALRADFNYLNFRKLSHPGFIASPGYHGCGRIDEDDVHRFKLYHSSDRIELQGGADSYEVDIDVKSDLTGGHDINVLANGKTMTTISNGRLRTKVTIPKAQILSVHYKDVTAPQSFFMSYTATVKRLPVLPTTTTSNPTTTTAASNGNPCNSPSAQAKALRAFREDVL